MWMGFPCYEYVVGIPSPFEWIQRLIDNPHVGWSPILFGVLTKLGFKVDKLLFWETQACKVLQKAVSSHNFSWKFVDNFAFSLPVMFEAWSRVLLRKK